jgi:uncharacterized OB-fold protein
MSSHATKLSRPFWDGIAGRRLLLQYDPLAKRYQFYPRPLSLFSATRSLEWREAAGSGTLIAHTLCHSPAKCYEGQVPYLVGIVRLDEGVKIFTRIVNADGADLAIGQRMRLSWDESGAETLFRFEPEGTTA